MNDPGEGIGLEYVSVGYGREMVLQGLSGHFALHSATAIIGPNGAGKSTLLKTIAGLLRPRQGRVTFQGCDASQIAYLPQRTDLERSFPLSLSDLVTLGAWRRIGAYAKLGPEQVQASVAALDRVGLYALRHRPVGDLSYGQLQRALFARLMMQDARIILLDEPFSAMDAATVSTLLEVIEAWRREGRTLIAALHDLGQVRQYFPNVLLLDRQVIAWGAAEVALAQAGSTVLAADCAGHQGH